MQPLSRAHALLPLLLFLGVALVLTAPAWTSADALVGGGDQPDWTGTLWASWWTGHALLHGLNPFDGTGNFFPVGQRPVAQYNLLDAGLFWPLLALAGPRHGYNLAVVLALVTSALGAVTLARSADAPRSAAVFAGLLVETSSYLLLEVTRGRLSQALLVFWLLGLAGLVRLSRGSGSPGLAVATGLAAAAAHLTYWYYGLFLSFAAVPLALLWARGRRAWLHLGVAAGVCLALCLPYVISLVSRYDGLPGVQRVPESWMDYGDLGRGSFGLSMAISQSNSPLWPIYTAPTALDDKRLPWVALGLAGLGLWRLGRERWGWVAVGLVGYILSLGPYLKGSDGVPLRWALPYLWLYDHLPAFDRLWWPQRLEILPLAAVAVLAARGLGSLPAVRWHGAACALLLLEVGLRSPYAPLRARPPRTYDAALYAAVDGPIITTPVLSSDELVRHLLWMQVHHEQSILGGLGEHLEAHRPPGYADYVRKRRLLRALERMSIGNFRDFIVYPRDIDELMEDGFRWAVVDPEIYTPSLKEDWAAAFRHIFSTLWGPPDIERPSGGAAWRLRPLDAEVTIPEIPAVEAVGPRSGGILRAAEGRSRPLDPTEATLEAPLTPAP